MKITFSPTLIKKAERWIILLIGLTVATTVGITLFASGRSIGDDLSRIPIAAIWWLALATFVESYLRFWRYHVASKSLSLGVSWWRLMYYYTVGYALLPTPGKVGTAIRIWLLKQYHNLPYRRTAPLMVMDLVSDTIAMCSLAALCLLLIDDPRLKTVGILVGAGLTFGIIATLVAPHLMVSCVKAAYWFSGKRKPRLFARVQALVRTTATVLGPKTLLVTTGLSFVGWALVGIAIAHLVTEFQITGFTAVEGTLAITLSTMGGFLTMMPAGVGGAEVTMAGLYTLFGVPFGIAVLVTAIVRLIVLWSTVLIGLALLPIALRNAPKERETTRKVTTFTVIENTTTVTK